MTYITGIDEHKYDRMQKKKFLNVCPMYTLTQFWHVR